MQLSMHHSTDDYFLFLITGTKVMDEYARIRIYIDDESTASLDFQLLLAHGIGFTEDEEAPNLPWGTKNIGHTADGGVFNTYRIPFSKSFTVTVTHPKGGLFWYIIRGVENYPLRVGDLILPANARLRLYKNVDVKLNPLEFLTLASISKSAGFLYQITIAARSVNYRYLEACGRARIDNSDSLSWLSSGTEDFFLSAYYFNKGIYHLHNSGLTYYDGAGTMSAYKFFENDPVLFSSSLELTWRCGETFDGDQGCPTDWPPPNSSLSKSPSPSDTTITTYTWVYEYSFQ